VLLFSSGSLVMTWLCLSSPGLGTVDALFIYIGESQHWFTWFTAHAVVAQHCITVLCILSYSAVLTCQLRLLSPSPIFQW
jgi:hypothetical protein